MPLPPEFQDLPSLETDSERVSRMNSIATAVRSGQLKTHEQVEEVLDSFGYHVGPFGCSSTQLEIAKEDLDDALRSKGLC